MHVPPVFAARAVAPFRTAQWVSAGPGGKSFAVTKTVLSQVPAVLGAGQADGAVLAPNGDETRLIRTSGIRTYQ